MGCPSALCAPGGHCPLSEDILVTAQALSATQQMGFLPPHEVEAVEDPGANRKASTGGLGTDPSTGTEPLRWEDPGFLPPDNF